MKLSISFYYISYILGLEPSKGESSNSDKLYEVPFLQVKNVKKKIQECLKCPTIHCEQGVETVRRLLAFKGAEI